MPVSPAFDGERVSRIPDSHHHEVHAGLEASVNDLLVRLALIEGTVDPPLGTCPGYAADVTGGAAGDTYIVTNLNPSGVGSLNAALTSYAPLNIRFQRNLAGTITHETITTVKPNKTIDGRGADITLSGAGFRIYGTDFPGVTSNMIWAYLNFAGASSSVTDDSLSISQGADLIWVTHCNFSDGADGLLDVSLFSADPGHSTRVTVSDCRFGPHPGPLNVAAEHVDGKSMLLGCTSAYTGNVATPRIFATVTGCVFDGTIDRNPAVFSTALCHFYNNVVQRWGTVDAVGSVGSQVFGTGEFLAEGNIYTPYLVGEGNPQGVPVTVPDVEAIKTTTNETNGVSNALAKAKSVDNLLENDATVVEQNDTTIFTPSYDYTALASSTDLRDALLVSAGNVQ
jgi:pectate lyase